MGLDELLEFRKRSIRFQRSRLLRDLIRHDYEREEQRRWAALHREIAPGLQATELKPSRLVASEQLNQHVTERHAALAIGERQFDPFGQSQDPTKRLPTPPPSGPGEGIGHGGRDQVPFNQVVDRIPVTIVMPKQERAMIGGKFFDVRFSE